MTDDLMQVEAKAIAALRLQARRPSSVQAARRGRNDPVSHP